MTITDEEREIDAAAALRLVQETKTAAAARAQAPGWYYPVVGVLFGLQTAALQAPWPGLGLPALIGTLVALVYYQKITGVQFNGLTMGGARSRGFMVFAIAVLIAGSALAGWLAMNDGSPWAVNGVALALALFVMWFGPTWERIFRRDQGARP